MEFRVATGGETMKPECINSHEEAHQTECEDPDCPHHGIEAMPNRWEDGLEKPDWDHCKWINGIQVVTDTSGDRWILGWIRIAKSGENSEPYQREWRRL